MWGALLRVWLPLVQIFDRVRLALLRWRHPGLDIHPSASSNLAAARYNLAPGSKLRIEAGVVTERRPGQLNFVLEPGATVVIREGAWLRTEIGPLYLVAFDGGHLEVGPDALLNGCHISCKRQVRIGRRAFVGPGVRVFDADQHDRDTEHAEQFGPVEIGDHVWVASDVTVLRGVRIGAHSVVGARSLVTKEVPPHTLVAGAPATARGEVGDRSSVR